MFKKLLATILLVCVLPLTSYAAIARGASIGAQNGAASNTLTITAFAAGVPANGVLFVTVQFSGTDSGCTWNGGAMTLVGSILDASIANQYLYGVLAPSGTHDIVCTRIGTGGRMTAVAYVYSGVKQSLTLDSMANNHNNDLANEPTFVGSTTVVAAGSWLVFPNSAGNFVTSASGNNATLFDKKEVGSCSSTTGQPMYVYDSNGTVSTGKQTMTQTYCADSQGVSVVFSIAPAPSATVDNGPLGLVNAFWVRR